MLGLCWTPAAIQSMQKMAATMPSNPEQLLGAILVRKDIFHRFETTMHDTCLDANNLLEYLFSLYNSTAAPAERDSLSPPQNFEFEVNHRDSIKHKRGTGRGQHTFLHQPNLVDSQTPQSAVHGRLLGTTQGQQPVAANGRRKKRKIDQPSRIGGVRFADEHEGLNESVSLKQFDSLQVFPCVNDNPTSCFKMEVKQELDSHPEQPSPLPQPFSRLHYQDENPESNHFSDALIVPPNEDSHQDLRFIAGGDESGNVKLEIEGALQGVLKSQQLPKKVLGVSKRTKKSKLKGSRRQSIDGSNGNYGEYTGRRRKAHQCFCGALFTRADNLKRHIRKCHEEKLEKLSAVPLDFDIDNNNIPAVDLSQAFPSSDQEALDSPPHQQDSQDSQQLGEQQQHKENNSMEAEAKWSCFCGESFNDHSQFVDHSQSHTSDT